MSITRFRGDTHALSISLKQNNAAVDLNLTNYVEFALNKGTETVIIECDKDVTPTTGIVYVPFTEASVDTAGTFEFDVQVTWTDGTKTTFTKSKLKLVEDVNKT